MVRGGEGEECRRRGATQRWKDEPVRAVRTKKGGIGLRWAREEVCIAPGRSYILQFQSPRALERRIVSIAANGRSISSRSTISLRRFNVAIGSRLIARCLRFAVNRLAVRVYTRVGYVCYVSTSDPANSSLTRGTCN